jgi:hypothetical protein
MTVAMMDPEEHREFNQINSGQERMIRVGDLRIDQHYQRNLKDGWARAIADNWDQFLYDPMDVSLREDGSMYVMDGQHRLAALRMLGYEDQMVVCRVFTGLTLAMEARRFNTQGNRKPLNAQEQFRSRLFEGQAAELAVDQCIRMAGFLLNYSGSETANGRVVCVGSLLSVYRSGGADHLLDSLNVIAAGFGRENGPSAKTVSGISAFLRKHGERADRTRLLTVMKQTTADQIERDTADMQRVMGFPPKDAYRRVLIKLYNARLSADRRIEE